MSFDRGDIVKLGRTAQETHTVIGSGGIGYLQVRQRSTGKVRIVQTKRCVLVAHKPTDSGPVDNDSESAFLSTPEGD